MAFYHLKRIARNKFAVKAPKIYKYYIDRKVASLPEFKFTGRENLCLAKKVAAFYAPEYRPHAADATTGAFTLFGHRLDFGAPENIDWNAKIEAEQDFHLWRMKLGHMGVVCPMLIDGKPEQLDAVSRLIDGYLESTSYQQPGAFTSYLFPYSVSHRLLALVSGFIIAHNNNSIPKDLEIKLKNFLRWNAGFILNNIEHELKNNHVERNLAALCLYFDALDNVSADLVSSLDRNIKEIIEACILPDGLLAERSAMYQGLSVMALMIFSESQILSQATRATAKERLEKAIHAWAIMTHPDGEISLFNDSWWGEVPPIDHIFPDRLPMRSLEILDSAGYARLAGAKIFAIFDAGPIGPSWNPGHGHGDFLSAEVDLDGKRFIVDPGTYQYSTGKRRLHERSVQSHNGPCWRDVNPVQYNGCFKVGKLAAASLVFDPDSTALQIAGKLELQGGIVQREVQLTNNDTLKFFDRWSDKPKAAQVTLIIQGEWALAERTSSSLSFRAGSKRGIISVETGSIDSIYAGQWARNYLKSEAATYIVLKPDQTSSSRGGSLKWTVRHL
ncbi:heparinase II/III family protein [Thalassovita mediterranea]|nr:heparinase II/III family protein [Thalassovita mediterranea]